MSIAEELRNKISNNIMNSSPPAPNLTKEEFICLDNLKNDKNIAIAPADKGRCVVILDKHDYNTKCLDLLNDSKTYKKINYNPTSGYRKKAVKLINDLAPKLGDKLKFQLTPASEPSVPGFYGLPKIHKPSPIPVRPIVSSIGSVTYNIAKHLASILSPLVGNLSIMLKTHSPSLKRSRI